MEPGLASKAVPGRGRGHTCLCLPRERVGLGQVDVSEDCLTNSFSYHSASIPGTVYRESPLSTSLLLGTPCSSQIYLPDSFLGTPVSSHPTVGSDAPRPVPPSFLPAGSSPNVVSPGPHLSLPHF